MAAKTSTNAADAKLQAVLGRQERDREVQLTQALRAVLKTYEGRLVFAGIIERGDARAHGFVRDPHEMNFRAGHRDFARQIETALESASYELCEAMRREAHARRVKDEQEAETYRQSGHAAREGTPDA